MPPECHGPSGASVSIAAYWNAVGPEGGGQVAAAGTLASMKLGPSPKGPASRHSDMMSNSVSVSAQTKHSAEAFEVASFMESTQGHLIRMRFAQQIGVPQGNSMVASPSSSTT